MVNGDPHRDGDADVQDLRPWLRASKLKRSRVNDHVNGDGGQGQRQRRPQPEFSKEELAQQDKILVEAAQATGLEIERLRRSLHRRTIDHVSPIVRTLFEQTIAPNRYSSQTLRLRSSPHFISHLGLPMAHLDNPTTSVTTKFVHTAINKNRCPINVVRWAPEGKRVITGGSSGEFTLWNGLTYQFETILQAHDVAVRAMEWSHSTQWLVTSDDAGTIKYWQPNMNNLKMLHSAHREAIRDITFSPGDEKFAVASDDGSIGLWDFAEGSLERDFKGHGWDVRCVDWHPTQSLLISGSKDNLVKFWDARDGKCLHTLHGHKNTVQAVQWNVDGNLCASASRDQLLRVYDIRVMRELAILRGHEKEVSSLAWHPVHPSLLASGGSEGALLFWSLNNPMPAKGSLEDRSSLSGGPSTMGPLTQVEFAHESNIWSLAWHPLGHILCTGSNDHTTRFWVRERPALEGSYAKGAQASAKSSGLDRFHIGLDRANELGLDSEALEGATGVEHDSEGENEAIDEDDGTFLPGLHLGRKPRDPATTQSMLDLPGLGMPKSTLYNPAPPPPPSAPQPALHSLGQFGGLPSRPDLAMQSNANAKFGAGPSQFSTTGPNRKSVQELFNRPLQKLSDKKVGFIPGLGAER